MLSKSVVISAAKYMPDLRSVAQVSARVLIAKWFYSQGFSN
jgi:hypothetical protein